MPYVKPYTYVNGNVLNGSDQDNNDSTAKLYVNQNILVTDLAAEAFDTADIERGELDPIVNHHQFTTGDVWGRFNDSAATRDRSYWTSHTKTNDTVQTSNNSKQYQALYECGDTIVVEHQGKMFFTFGATIISQENDVNTKGKWDSRVYLMVSTPSNPQPVIIGGTRMFTYEETTTASAGTTNPGSVNLIGTPAPKNETYQNRRWMQFQWMYDVSPGVYRFFVAVNPKVEIGYSSARQFTMELFYNDFQEQG